MKIEVGKVYETRDGRLARVLCTDRKFDDVPVMALITDKDGREWCHGYRSNGASTGNYERDLIREHVPVTYRWINIYSDTEVGVGWREQFRMNGSIGLIKLAFDPSGNLIPDKCEITGAQPNG